MEQAVDLAKQSDSTIMILMVIIVLSATALIPVIKTIAKVQDKRRNLASEREDKLLRVIEKNTEVNTAIKTLIEHDQKHCNECKQEQRALFQKLFDNHHATCAKLDTIVDKLEKDGA